MQIKAKTLHFFLKLKNTKLFKIKEKTLGVSLMCVRAFRVERLSPRQTNKQTNKQNKSYFIMTTNILP